PAALVGRRARHPGAEVEAVGIFHYAAHLTHRLAPTMIAHALFNLL
ncbi:MAG: hypothetical protein QOF81_499, partial [Acidimicrobiaceae bacterium]|nr:hypothetical protein [Acidimicrobiaceae bacterium]